MIIDAFIGNVLILNQNVTTNIRGQSVEHRIVFTDTIRKNIQLVSVDNKLALSSRHSLQRSCTYVSVTSSLALSQTQARTKFGEVVQALGIYQSLRTVQGGEVSQLLTLAQVANGWIGHSIGQNLTFAQSITPIIRRDLLITQTFQIFSQQAGFLPNPNFIGIELSAIIPQKPTVAFANVSITLRSPEWSNVERTDMSRIIRRTRAGTLIVYRQPTWPKSETLAMQIADLSPLQSSQLLNFMNQTMGQRIQFTDHEGTIWQGYIMTPATQAAEQYRNSFVVNLEFQGSKL